MNRLDFGSAFEKNEGWTAFDLIEYGHNIVGDILDGLPFPDNHFDMITAHHSIQMIRFDDLQRALSELNRVLKPGGTLRISVPDAYQAIVNFMGLEDSFPISREIEPTVDGRFLRYLFWHGDARSAFTPASLADALSRAGFVYPNRCKFNYTVSNHPEIVELDSREAESIFMEVTK